MTNAPLHLCTRLIDELEEQKVDYLHWKSSVRLSEALAGKTDLDLRVAPASRQRFEALVRELGFVALPGMHPSPGAGGGYFVGFDEGSGRLVHLDVVSDFQTGGYLAKPYRLNAIGLLTTDTRSFSRLPIPEPDRELAFFVLRKALESASLLEMGLLYRERARVSSEIAWLQLEGARWDRSCALLASHFRELSEVDLDRFFAALTGGHLLAQRRAGRQIAEALDGSRIYPALPLAFTRIRAFARKVLQKLRGQGPGWTLASPAPLLAFVGPKAAGKSTIVGDVHGWLGQYFRVRRVHSGRPPATILTAPIRLVDRLVASILLPKDRRKGLSALPRTDLLARPSLSGFAFVVHALLLAHEKRALLRRVKRWMRGGTIVISDRYPIGEWDGPKLRGGTGGPGWFGAFVRAATRWEQRMFDGLPRPDVIVRLHIDEATALERNRDRLSTKGRSDEDAAIRARLMEDFSLLFPGVSILDVSTAGTLDEVRLAVRARIWQWLTAPTEVRRHRVDEDTRELSGV